MTTKKAPKAAKAPKAPKAYVATVGHIALATTCGEALNTAGSAKARAAEAAGKLHAAKAVVGAKGKCPLAIAYVEARFPNGKNAKGEKVSAATVDTVLGEFRKAVKTGKGYDENAARKTGGKKGAKKGAKQNSGAIMIVIGRKDTAPKAAEKFLTGINKMKSANDALAGLAAFLIDSLNEAKGKKYNPLAK